MIKFRNCKVVGKGIDPDAYHRQTAERGAPDFAVSPSVLKAFLPGECAERWKDGYTQPESSAKDWGNLMDTLLTDENAFPNKYHVLPETYPAPADHDKVKKGTLKAGDPLRWNSNAGYCKDWVKRNGSGREAVSADDYHAASAAWTRLMRNQYAVQLMTVSDRQVMVVGEAEVAGVIIPVRCLIDFKPSCDSRYWSSLADLKTTKNAAARSFRRWAFDAGYDIQAAFDLDLFNAATDEERDTWCLIIQENIPPFQVTPRMMSQQFIGLGRTRYVRALELYAECLKSGVWPGYEANEQTIDGWAVLEPEPWMTLPEAFATPQPAPPPEEPSEMPS